MHTLMEASTVDFSVSVTIIILLNHSFLCLIYPRVFLIEAQEKFSAGYEKKRNWGPVSLANIP